MQKITFCHWKTSKISKVPSSAVHASRSSQQHGDHFSLCASPHLCVWCLWFCVSVCLCVWQPICSRRFHVVSPRDRPPRVVKDTTTGAGERGQTVKSEMSPHHPQTPTTPPPVKLSHWHCPAICDTRRWVGWMGTLECWYCMPSVPCLTVYVCACVCVCVCVCVCITCKPVSSDTHTHTEIEREREAHKQASA